MKAQDLMKPRFEIIADFPYNDFGEVGDILDRDWCKYKDNNEEGGCVMVNIRLPSLIQKVELVGIPKRGRNAETINL